MNSNIRNEIQYEKVKEFYNKDAKGYQTVRYGSKTILQLGYIIRREIAIEMCDDIEGRILDIGCGPGTFLEALRNSKRELYATDLSINMVNEAKENQLNDEKIHYMASNLTRLGFQANSFDGVICMGVLGYIPSLRDALKELYRVMRKGGVAILQTSNPSTLKEKLYEKVVPYIKKKIGIKKKHGFGFDFPLYSYNKQIFDRKIAEHGFQLLEWRYYDFHIPFLERFSMKKTVLLASWLQRFDKNRFIGLLLGSGYLVKIKKI